MMSPDFNSVSGLHDISRSILEAVKLGSVPDFRERRKNILQDVNHNRTIYAWQNGDKALLFLPSGMGEIICQRTGTQTKTASLSEFSNGAFPEIQEVKSKNIALTLTHKGASMATLIRRDIVMEHLVESFLAEANRSDIMQNITNDEGLRFIPLGTPV